MFKKQRFTYIIYNIFLKKARENKKIVQPHSQTISKKMTLKK